MKMPLKQNGDEPYLSIMAHPTQNVSWIFQTQEVTPNEVPIAVRIVMMVWMIIFQMSFFVFSAIVLFIKINNKELKS